LTNFLQTSLEKDAEKISRELREIYKRIAEFLERKDDEVSIQQALFYYEKCLDVSGEIF
jgi:hypothetical protein